MGFKIKGNITPKGAEQRGEKAKAIAKDIQSKMNKANKRIKRLEKSGKYATSKAYAIHIKEKGAFGTKGKSYNQLLAEQKRINKFIASKTSTVRGTDDDTKRIMKMFKLKENKENRKLMESHAEKFFELFKKAMEFQFLKGENSLALSSDRIQDEIGKKVESKEINIENTEESLGTVLDDLIGKFDDVGNSMGLKGEANAMSKLAKVGEAAEGASILRFLMGL